MTRCTCIWGIIRGVLHHQVIDWTCPALDLHYAAQQKVG